MLNRTSNYDALISNCRSGKKNGASRNTHHIAKGETTPTILIEDNKSKQRTLMSRRDRSQIIQKDQTNYIYKPPISKLRWN